jgi:YD repeat-containing protein
MTAAKYNAITTFDTDDRLLTSGDWRYAYTDHGELLEKENILTGTKLTLTYDERGQLTRAILPGGQTIQYSIDGEGNRLAKTVDGVLSSVYLHDVQGRLVAELDPSGVFKSRFIYATQAHSPDYMIRGGVNYFFAKDQLGSIRAVVDSNSGNVL